ncbi:MAG: hypothetical protein GPOALKHO_000627 [Sodalis sp.]|nr:MAG: hypothetical protein GPOALKHO_000627 [Sodalis sp.]
MVLAIFTAAAISFLFTCTVYDHADNYLNKPVVSDLKRRDKRAAALSAAC